MAIGHAFEPPLFTLPMALANASSSFGISQLQRGYSGLTAHLHPTIVVFLVFQRQLVRGIALTGLNLCALSRATLETSRELTAGRRLVWPPTTEV